MSASTSVAGSATLAQLAELDLGLAISCTNPGCLPLQKLARRWAWHVSAADAVARWGGETTLEQLRPRLRCELCGERRAMIEPVPSREAMLRGVHRRSDC